MLVAGLAGIAVGYGVAMVAVEVAALIVDFFNEVGGILVILLVGAILLHFFAPLFVPATAVLFLKRAARGSRCRSPAMGERVGWLLSPVAAGVAVWFATRLIEMPAAYDRMLEGMVGDVSGLIIGLPTALAFGFTAAKSGWIFLGVVALLALLLLPALSEEAGTDPYCEEKGAWLTPRLVGRYSFEHLEPALIGLYLGSGPTLRQLESLPLDQKVDDKEARLDLVVFSGPDRASNLVELTAHYSPDGKEQLARRLFSEWMSRSQIETLTGALGVSLAVPRGQAG